MYIDVRSKNKYLLGHINDAINIDYYELFFNYEKYLQKNKKYYIYCDTGTKSKILVNRLRGLGYNCVNIEGGYNNYLVNK